MNEQCTRFQTNLSRVANHLSGWDGQVNNALHWGIPRNYCENQQYEALFAEALRQVEGARATPSKSVLLDWEDFEKKPSPHLGLARALSPYRVKMLASAIASYQLIRGTRLQRQVRTVIARLTREPRPSHSIELPLEDERSNWQARKIQLDSLWILYAVDEGNQQAIVIEIASGEHDAFSTASPENLNFSDRSNLLGDWAYHYC